MRRFKEYPGVTRLHPGAVEVRLVLHAKTFEALERLAFRHCRNPGGQLTYALLTMLGMEPRDDQVLADLLAKAGNAEEVSDAAG